MGAIFNWLRTNYRGGEPARNLCDARERNRINNILQDISGIGCRIYKPIDADGKGWKIIFDGTSDDVPPTDELGGEEITVVTQAQFDAPYLQVKTRTIRVISADEESAWTNVAEAEPCP